MKSRAHCSRSAAGTWRICFKSNLWQEERRCDDDFISLTDIARYKNDEEPNVVVANWLRNRNTVEFLGIWEQLHNPDFKPLEFEGFRKEAGLNAFTLSPMKEVNAFLASSLLSCMVTAA